MDVKINSNPLNFEEGEVTLFAVDSSRASLRDALIMTWLRAGYGDAVEFHYLHTTVNAHKDHRGTFLSTHLESLWHTLEEAIVGKMFGITTKTSEFFGIHEFTMEWWGEHDGSVPCQIAELWRRTQEQAPDLSESDKWDAMLAVCQQWTECFLGDAHRHQNLEDAHTEYARAIQNEEVYT
jgi:hypothetical protein